MDPLIGTRMGPYNITELIGEGGMAIVYKGFQESLHRYVALKVLRDELARDQQFVARFRQEALAAANLNHPNIVHVYDAGSSNGKYFIAMAYVDGGTLKDLIQQRRINPERAVSIAIQLAEALDHAHNQGLIHRDVKPNNVLMTRDGRPLLTDFGIAKALYDAKQLTRTGTSIGTPEYMAPEQAQGRPPDGRTDIYALGIVLYEMLASKVPFCTDTPVATMYMHVHEPPPPLRQAGADTTARGAVPEWLENVVCKALAKDPADRYATAGLFAAALRQGQEAMRAAARPVTPADAAASDAVTAIGPAAAAAEAAKPKKKRTWGRAKRTPTPSSDAPTAIGPAAAAAAQRTPTPSSDAPTAIGPAAAAAAQRTPTPSSDAPTALGPAAAAAAQRTPTPVGAVTPAGAAAQRTPTPTPIPDRGGAVAAKRRPKALVPILIAAIALLVVATGVSAAILLIGGSDDTPAIVTVVVDPDTPTATEVLEEGETGPTATEEEEAGTTPTYTLTPSRTPSATTTTSATPTGTASRTPTTSPTPTGTATRTPTATGTVTRTPTPTNTEPPTPTDTPVTEEPPPPPPPPPATTEAPPPPPP